MISAFTKMNVVRHGLAFVLVLLVRGVLISAETLPSIPTAGPMPRTVPQVPGRTEKASPEQSLLLHLSQVIEEHDQRIADLGSRVPIASRQMMNDDPMLEKPRKERDQAYADLTRALEAFGGHHKEIRDVLEVARPSAKASQAGPIAAANQLRIVECYQELIQGGNGTPEDLAAGKKTLGKSSPKDLPLSDQPRWWYLRVWFIAEEARRESGDKRAALFAEAQEAQRAMAGAFPGIELTAAAQALTLDVARPPSVMSPGTDAAPVPSAAP